MPYKPGKKRIDVGKTHGFIGDLPSKKAKPKEWAEPEWIADYRIKRDRVIFSDMFTCEESKELILNKYKK